MTSACCTRFCGQGTIGDAPGPPLTIPCTHRCEDAVAYACAELLPRGRYTDARRERQVLHTGRYPRSKVETVVGDPGLSLMQPAGIPKHPKFDRDCFSICSFCFSGSLCTLQHFRSSAKTMLPRHSFVFAISASASCLFPCLVPPRPQCQGHSQASVMLVQDTAIGNLGIWIVDASIYRCEGARKSSPSHRHI